MSEQSPSTKELKYPAWLAAFMFAAIAAYAAMMPGKLPDFFIYRLGSKLTLHGQNPYDLKAIRERVAIQFPEDEEEDDNSSPYKLEKKPKEDGLISNCGYFLPPQAAVLLMPLAVLPFDTAKIVWALLQGLAGLAITSIPLLLRKKDDPLPTGLLPKLVPFAMLMNFLAVGILLVGQTTLVCVGSIAAGLWCFARETKWGFWLGVLLWSVPFIKPHVALALIPLAWYLGGWKRAAAILGVVAALNLLGATLIGGSPLFLRDYVHFLTENHQAVKFNRAELNYEMTSWNRLLYVVTEAFAGKPILVEQNAAVMLASYLVWFGLLVGRCAIAGVKPSASWALAAGAVGAAWCPQVLVYETLMLLLAVPWVRDLFVFNRQPWGLLAIALLVLQAIPVLKIFGEPGFMLHRPLGVALLALLVLIGPILGSGDRRQETEKQTH